MRFTKMRIGIREQLGALVLISSLIGVAVVAIATWTTNRSFVLSVSNSRLSLTASLKSAQLSTDLMLMQSSVRSTTSRLLLQSSLMRYNQMGNNTLQNWIRPIQDLQTALSSSPGALGYQGAVLPLNGTAPINDTAGFAGEGFLMNTTTTGVIGMIELPTRYSDGSPVFLGDNTTLGYPRNLYPNLTYSQVHINKTFKQSVASYNGQPLDTTHGLLLGPWFINDTFSLISITMPIINNTSAVDILGWLTIVMSGQLISNVASSPEGLENTGVALIVGPANATNHFPRNTTWQNNNGSAPQTESVHFVIPANNTGNRHPDHASISNSPPFDYNSYPAVKAAFTKNSHGINNAGSSIDTHNEQGDHVAVGYAMVTSTLVDWVILVEQSHGEVWAPISHLRNILLACVFGTAGAMLLLAFPIAHFSSLPIRRLRDATKKSIAPPGFEEDGNSIVSSHHGNSSDDDAAAQAAHKEGFYGALSRWRTGKKKSDTERSEAARRRGFRIPAKVKERKHIVQDELTELTTTFNEMTDELMMQYEKLEERVKQRTAELELSKKAAEAANESKTLFIANLSHELKTPLNGIMGMCAVCMSERDPAKIQKSLGIIYKSGDLLLNLLTDLLTFSKNQVGQHLTLDEKEFRLRDVSAQVLAIFDKQAKEGSIGLHIRYEGPQDANMNDTGQLSEKRDLGPSGTGRVKDMILWGDQHRILQVLINLVSNSLKFTPPGGSVSVTIRCIGDAQPSDRASSRKGSTNSRGSRNLSGRNSRTRVGHGSDASFISSQKNLSTALEINALDSKPAAQFMMNERSDSPPAGRNLMFEFEVVDTGPGVPESQQQRIFEPFVQGDLGLSKKYGGTGLGLSICSQLATLMKGTIGMTSEMGHGSTFTMQIPLRHIMSRADSTSSSTVDPGSRRSSLEDAAAALGIARSETGTPMSVLPPQSVASSNGGVDSKPRLVGLSQPFFAAPALDTAENRITVIERAAAEASEKGVKVKVLVAEDNKTNQEVVLRMLKLEDIFDVTVAQDGQEAYERVKESMESQTPYNLIFMDVQMPNLNGLESTRLIRQTGYSAPIVALSAYSEDSNIKECLESGMNDFISKPIRRPRLKQVLKTFCSPIPEEVEEKDTTPGPAASAPKPGGSASTTSTKVETMGNANPPMTTMVKPPTQRKEGDPGGGSKAPNGPNGPKKEGRPESPVSPLS
ncbi:hypothetical protein NA57DRAFT_48442 [Rhizodiscina lignyota]|uniref:histidine kinase n=1 Tax=Rhizodiscina lignyota TaxID=1504668 RepID=A0A9P4I4Q1_9PEZI|nr:hypothetical protein NA57DRAFT_48442 [Rhizodiscina lignyota]